MSETPGYSFLGWIRNWLWSKTEKANEALAWRDDLWLGLLSADEIVAENQTPGATY
jgi:hypothetical protein